MWLSKKFKSILWEYDLSKLEHSNKIVVERVLNLWDIDIFKEWIKQVWNKDAKKLYIKYRYLLDKKNLLTIGGGNF